MIFEQAFFALPEFLVGAGFTRYDSEGTLVMAYAMPILQELNGRNINNPISLISGEKNYPSATNRSADLHLNYEKIGLINSNLEMFGVQPECWLEAKFFRKNNERKPTLDKTLAVYALMRDLLRLSIFPHASPKSARFLLHAYEGKPNEHLSMSLNAGKKDTDKKETSQKPRRIDRTWLHNIIKPGSHKLDFKDIPKEPAAFNSEIGDAIRAITATLDVTNFCIDPAKSSYSLHLTRIDGFSIEWNNNKAQISINEICDSSGLKEIQTLLNNHLKK